MTVRNEHSESHRAKMCTFISSCHVPLESFSSFIKKNVISGLMNLSLVSPIHSQLIELLIISASQRKQTASPLSPPTGVTLKIFPPLSRILFLSGTQMCHESPSPFNDNPCLHVGFSLRYDCADLMVEVRGFLSHKSHTQCVYIYSITQS